MHKNSLPTSLTVDPHTPSPLLISLPQHLQRKIAARWQEWIPWVLIDLRRREHDAANRSAEFDRIRRRHSEHLLHLMRLGIEMRLVRRHRLDDPRISDEDRAVLVRSVEERRRKARSARHPPLDNLEVLT